MQRAMVEQLETTGRRCGLDAFGVATAEPFDEARIRIEHRKALGLHAGMWFTYGRPERSTDPGRILDGAKSIIVGAINYHRQGSDVDGDRDGSVARYVWQRYYEQLQEALEAVAEELRIAGWIAEVVLDDNRLVDRAAAHRAGLGWFGKNTNLLLGDLGSWFVLGCVVTDCALPAGNPIMEDGCGSCVRCQIACPTGALDDAGVLDARRCIAWLLQADGVFPVEHRVALGSRIYGCDECQEVCPPNTRAVRVATPRQATEHDQATVDLVEMLMGSDEQLMERLGHWYVPRRRPEYLRRNALLVLGNVGRGDDPSVREVMDASLRSASPIVRAHAVWAVRRLGLEELLASVCDATEQDPMVLTELERPHVPALLGGER